MTERRERLADGSGEVFSWEGRFGELREQRLTWRELAKLARWESFTPAEPVTTLTLPERIAATAARGDQLRAELDAKFPGWEEGEWDSGEWPED